MLKIIFLFILLIVTGCEKKPLTNDQIENQVYEMKQARFDINNENWKSAEINLKQVLILEPEYPRAHLDLAIIYHQHLTNYIHAIYHYDKYLELNPLSVNNYFINEQKNNLKSHIEKQIISKYITKTKKINKPNIRENEVPEKKQITYITYTVVTGDTLSKIANKFYNNPNEYTKIFNANKSLKNAQDIRVGQKIIIPK